MAELPRLNGIIRALEKGGHAFVTFSSIDTESAIALGAQTKYDGVVFEAEHGAWDGPALRDCLQYLLNRQLIAASGSLAPSVTPMVRVPVNGAEMGHWHAKQALDLGAYGIIWPHISTVEEATNAVAACRYPRLPSQPRYAPAGIRGDGPGTALRYWGVSQADYYKRADVWPLDPVGEVFVVLMIEDTTGIKNLKDILKNVPGIGAILIGEGDLSQELGIPRQYENKILLDAMAEVRARCKEAGVVVGHPHVEVGNAQRIIDEGYRFLMCAPVRSYGHLDKAREIAGRK